MPPVPSRPQPARVLPPLIPILIVFTIVTISALVALVVLPLFTAAGGGVDAFRERLRAAGVGRITIPRFPERSTIYAADGSVLATVFLDENRRIVQLENVAQVARDAVVAIEDRTFYEHGALDYRSLIRAAIVNLQAGEIEQGGSTITQQLVKNAIIGDTSQTFARKFQEAALALRLERRYTKDEILELYINDVYFGNGAYGIGTAAETYFRRKPSDLTLAQGALLAGVIRAPGAYDPLVHPEAATTRRNHVIDQMVSLGMVTEEQGEKAKARPLGLAKGAGAPKQRLEPFFVTYIRTLILENETGEFDAFGVNHKQRVHTLYQGGLRIHTTLDPDWQRYAQEAVLTRMNPNRGPDASLVSVDARSGAIRAMLSGKNYRKDQYDLVWQGRRQTGSAFKPFTLVAAFANGFPPGSVYSSKSPNCSIPGWRSESGCVSNAEGASGGSYVDLWNATENSTNVVFAQLAVDVGPENIVEAAHKMGVQAPLDAVPSITLGVEEVSTLDMATGYATLANDGTHCEPFAVARVEQPKEGGGWERLYRHKRQCRQAIEPDIAHLVTAMLQRVVCCGTGTVADDGMGRPVAGKTGTAQDYTNVYFAGYTPQVATAVWVGFPEGQKPMNAYYGQSVFGGTLAAPIWNAFMRKATAGMPVERFEAPPRPESGEVPDVVGLMVEDAERVLAKADFTPLTNTVSSSEPKGTVIGQTPRGGATMELGSAVKLEVSDGKGEPVLVPRVVGLRKVPAVQALTKVGLIADVRSTEVKDESLVDRVVSQSPHGNKEVDVGTTVTIWVGIAAPGGGGGGDGGGDGGGGPPNAVGRRPA